MTSVLAIGGTRFIGRHTVEAFLDDDHTVTLFNRGNHENPFADDDRVETVHGDRTDDGDIEAVAERTDPDVVLDFVAYQPGHLETAIDAFPDVDAYVYVSSVGAYEKGDVLIYEEETPLLPCSPSEATDDSFATYGKRKAEGDRVIAAAAEEGVPAMSVRPSMVYGPHDYSDRFAYWVERVREHDRVLVPGDGSYICHGSYVGNVARGIRAVAEAGTPGAAYNVADRLPLTIEQTVERIADAADTDVEVSHASERELGHGDLSRTDFPLFMQPTPFVLSTAKLADLGWAAITPEAAIAETVSYYADNAPPGQETWPARDREERVLEALS